MNTTLLKQEKMQREIDLLMECVLLINRGLRTEEQAALCLQAFEKLEAIYLSKQEKTK